MKKHLIYKIYHFRIDLPFLLIREFSSKNRGNFLQKIVEIFFNNHQKFSNFELRCQKFTLRRYTEKITIKDTSDEKGTSR